MNRREAICTAVTGAISSAGLSGVEHETIEVSKPIMLVVHVPRGNPELAQHVADAICSLDLTKILGYELPVLIVPKEVDVEAVEHPC